MTATLSARFRTIGGTAAEWAANDIVPLLRELALETDTRKFKFGDGVTAYSALPYASGVSWGGITGTLSDQTDLQSALDAKLDDSQLDTDGTLAANSDTRIATQKAVKTYADTLVAAQDAMVFKGVIDCSANPNYPAADRGHTYRVSVAGKIGGGSGVNVEVGDLLLCLTDGTSAGTQAAVGSNWSVIQTNLDGAVIGPSSATDGGLVAFDGTTGKLVKAATVTGTGSAVLASSPSITTPTFTTNIGITGTTVARINFTSDSAGTPKTGRFEQDASGNMIFRQFAGSMFFDFFTALNVRNSSFTNVFDIDGTGIASAAGGFRPKANDGAALGSATVSFADLFLASGAVVNFANGNATLTHSTGKIASNVPLQLPSYTVAGVPAASLGAGSIIYVSNESGGAVLAFSDGTDWRRVTDRAVIS